MNAIEAMKEAAKQLAQSSSASDIPIFTKEPHRAKKIISVEDRIKTPIQKGNVTKKFSVSDVETAPSKILDSSNLNKKSEAITEEDYDKMFYKQDEPTIDESSIEKKYNEARAKATAEPAHETIVRKSSESVAIPPEHHMVNIDAKVNQLDNHAVFSSTVPSDDGFVFLDETPSKNLFYSKHPMVQPMKLKDLLIVENIDDNNMMDSFTEIFSRRIKNVDAMELLSGDENYVLQYLRASTFPKDPYTWQYFKCKECGHEVNDAGYKIDFTNMIFRPSKEPEEVYNYHKEYGYCPIKVSNEHYELYVRRRKHDYFYKQKLDSIKGTKEYSSKPYLALLNMALVLEIPGCNSVESKIEKLGNLSKDDSIDLLTGISEASFKTKTFVVHTCPKCGGKTVTPFPFRLKTFVSSVQLIKPKGK